MLETRRNTASDRRSLRSTQNFRVLLKSRQDRVQDEVSRNRERKKLPDGSQTHDASYTRTSHSQSVRLLPHAVLSSSSQPKRITLKKPVNRKEDLIKLKKYVTDRMKTHPNESHQKPSQSNKDVRHRNKESSKAIGDSIPIQLPQNKPYKQQEKAMNSQLGVIFRHGESQMPHVPLSLKELQERVDTLIQNQMDEASMHKGKAPEQIDELNWLLQQMHQVRDAEGQETGHSLQEIDIYIRILEKVLAKKATESQILKKYYFGKLNQAKHRRTLTKQQATFYNSWHMLEQERRSKPTDERLKALEYESTQRSSFRKPEDFAYNIYRYQNVFFNADRHKQPLHRSNYNRDYLRYAVAPSRSILPRDSNWHLGPAHRLSTCYQDQFISRKGELINYRKLDCFRDKFKDLAINFVEKERQHTAPECFDLSEEREGRRKTLPQPVHYLKHSLVSESKREYQKSEETRLKSRIRHENLEDLKSKFKAQMKL